MKTCKNLWEKFISEENFKLAYKNAIKNKSNQEQIIRFKKNEEENLKAVRQLVIDGKFRTSKYKEKKIFEPKERTIYKLPFCPDRIVQHAVMNILIPIFTNRFIENSYACIEGRGQLKASIKCAEYVRRYDYCLKCDIRKFYPSINQKILSEKLHRIIKDEKFMELIDDIIFSFEGGYNCPIGNYCSQWFGNFYLTELDNYVLHELKPGGYERYCDDFMLFDDDKKYLKECKEKIEIFIKERLELEYSKADLFHVKQGVDFVGYRHFRKFILVRKRTAKRLKNRCKEIEENIDTIDLKKVESQLASARGLTKHACSYHLRKKIKLEELTKEVKERKMKKPRIKDD